MGIRGTTTPIDGRCIGIVCICIIGRGAPCIGIPPGMGIIGRPGPPITMLGSICMPGMPTGGITGL